MKWMLELNYYFRIFESILVLIFRQLNKLDLTQSDADERQKQFNSENITLY